MKCHKCGKRIKLKWVIQYILHPIRYEEKYCIDCLIIEFNKIRDEFIFRGDASQID